MCPHSESRSRRSDRGKDRYCSLSPNRIIIKMAFFFFCWRNELNERAGKNGLPRQNKKRNPQHTSKYLTQTIPVFPSSSSSFLLLSYSHNWVSLLRAFLFIFILRPLLSDYYERVAGIRVVLLSLTMNNKFFFPLLNALLAQNAQPLFKQSSLEID